MKIDENKVEVVGGILFGVGIFLIFFGMSAPLIAGAILSGSVVIAKSINRRHTDVELGDRKGGDDLGESEQVRRSPNEKPPR